MNKSSKKHMRELKRQHKRAEIKRAKLLKARKVDRPVLTGVAHSVKSSPVSLENGGTFNRGAWGAKNAET